MSIITRRQDEADALDKILYQLQNAGAAHLKFYTGSAPGAISVSATGTMLADLTGQPSGDLFGATNATTLRATANTGGSPASVFKTTDIDATGTAGYWRIFDNFGSARLQGSVGVTGSGADIELNTLSLIQHGSLTINTGYIEVSGSV